MTMRPRDGSLPFSTSLTEYSSWKRSSCLRENDLSSTTMIFAHCQVNDDFHEDRIVISIHKAFSIIRPKKVNSFWSHKNSKLTLWRWFFFSCQNLMIDNIFVRAHTTQKNETKIVDAPIADSAFKTASCLNNWSNKGNQILHRRPSVCPVRMQVTKLHGAIWFFVISCSVYFVWPHRYHELSLPRIEFVLANHRTRNVHMISGNALP